MKKILLILVILAIYSSAEAGYHRGLKYFTYKKYDKAREELLKAVERNEKNGNAYYFLGEIEKLNNNFEEAFKYYTLAIENPIKKKYRKLAFWNLVVIHEQNNKIEEVVKTCKLFWEKTRDKGAKKKVEGIINKLLWSANSEAKEAYARGLELKSGKKPQAAIEKFYKAIEIDNTFLAPRFELGFHYYNNNNLTEATNHLEPIAQKVPFHSSVNQLLGNIYFKNKSFKNAIEYFEKVLIYGFNGKKTRYMMHLKRGTSYYNLGDYEKAEYDINECLKLKSRNKKPLFLLSAIYIKTEDYDSALKILNRLHRILPRSKEVIYQIGSIYYKLENRKFYTFFDKLFNLVLPEKKKVPEKYNKAFKKLGEYHYSIRSYHRAARILNTIPTEQMNARQNIMTARANYNINQFSKTIELLEKLSLNNDESLLLIKAYIKEGNDIKAGQLLTSIIDYDSAVKDKALNDYVLSPLARKIIKEKELRQEEERKRIEEMKQKELAKQQEEEKRRAEELRRIEKEKAEKELEKGSSPKDETSSPADNSSSQNNQASAE